MKWEYGDVMEVILSDRMEPFVLTRTPAHLDFSCIY